MAITIVTKENFETEVLHADKPVIIDFWAEWCGPCKMFLPIIHELAEELTEAKVCKVNVDEQPDLARQFNIMSIPTLVIMKDGKITNQSAGVKSKQAIKEMIL